MLQDQRRKMLKKKLTTGTSTNDILAPLLTVRSDGDGMEKEAIQNESPQLKESNVILKANLLSEKTSPNLNDRSSPYNQAETENKSSPSNPTELENKLLKKQKEIRFIPHEPYKAAVEPYPFMLSSAFKPSISRHRTKSDSKKGNTLNPIKKKLQSPTSDINIKKFPYSIISNLPPNLDNPPLTASAFSPSFVSLHQRDFFNLKFKDDINLKEDIQGHINAFHLKLQRDPISQVLKDDSRYVLETLSLKLMEEACGIDKTPKEENRLLNEQNRYLREESRKLLEEKEELISQLNMQSKVNTELKKLLVASVGEDLQLRFELLTRDKAKLAHDIHCYSEKLCHDFEQLEKLSIQCDVWRSKFLASRVMVDELANWKALLCRKYEESRDALAQLLMENKDIKTELLQVYRISRNIKEKLNPNNNQDVLNTCNFMHLTRSVGFLIDSIYVKLFGDRSTNHLTADMCHCEDFTPAEKCAFKILSNHDIELNEALQIDLAASFSGSRIGLINRFHPQTKFEQLTISCCGNCKGDIKVV